MTKKRKWSNRDRWSLRLLGSLLLLGGGVAVYFGGVVLWESRGFGVDFVWIYIFGLPFGLVIGAGVVSLYCGWRFILDADADAPD